MDFTLQYVFNPLILFFFLAFLNFHDSHDCYALVIRLFVCTYIQNCEANTTDFRQLDKQTGNVYIFAPDSPDGSVDFTLDIF